MRTDLRRRVLKLHLNVPAEAPLEEGLEVTALGGLRIPSIPARLFGRARFGRHAPGKIKVHVDGNAVLRHLSELQRDHPELLLTDDEIRSWLATGIAPAIPPGEVRTLWLTLESPRVGIKKLKAHVPVKIMVGL